MSCREVRQLVPKRADIASSRWSPQQLPDPGGEAVVRLDYPVLGAQRFAIEVHEDQARPCS